MHPPVAKGHGLTDGRHPMVHIVKEFTANVESPTGLGRDWMKESTMRAGTEINRGARKLTLSLAALMAALLLSGCMRPAQTAVSGSVVEAMSVPAASKYARALEAMEFVFPRDHGPHPDFRTEWWYYTGNLQDEAGNDYGYQLTFFRSALAAQAAQRTSTLATNQVYMAHFALTDGARDEHESFERYSRGAGGLAGARGEPTFQVWLEDWSAVQTQTDTMQLTATAEGQEGPVAIDLTLHQTRPPVLQGNAGLDQKGTEPGNASYYYSLTGLETSGLITSAGQAISGSVMS